MPIYQILPQGASEEADDTPKYFTNIDTEPFEFWWAGKPYGGLFSDRFIRLEDEIKINADGYEEKRAVYEITKPLQPDETVMMPKYLVNYAATHLSKKMYKREAFASFQGTENEKRNAAIKFINPKELIKLMEKMVAKNFPDKIIEEPEMPTKENVIDENQVDTPPKPTFKCEKCGFEAKSEAGLKSHQRKKH